MIKFGHLVKYITRETFFLKNYAENETVTLVTPDCFLFFKKALYEVKQVVYSLVSKYFDSSQLGIQKKKTIKL